MNDLKFRCFKCQKDSPFEISPANRGEVQRLVSDGKSMGQVTFICVHCGFANTIDITLDTATKLLERISSDDPEVQDAIERAKKGDYSKAIEAAKNRFGLKF